MSQTPSGPAPIRVSIVIVSFNLVEHLRQCLRSIERHPPDGSFEVVVIDNASTDSSASMVATEFPSIRLIRRTANDGYGVALNEAAASARGEVLVFLNPDIEVRPGALQHLVEFLKGHPKAAVVGPRLELADGRPQSSARQFCSSWRLLLEASRLPLLLPASTRANLLLGTYFDHADTRLVPWVSGACHVMTSAVWSDVGPLTEDTFCGFDDYDFCHRARSRGYEVWLDAGSTMIHRSSAAVRARWDKYQVEELAIHNTYVVLDRHWPRWRVKGYMAAELAAYLLEWGRVSLPPRRRESGEYRDRLRRRTALLAALLTGREQPIARLEPAPPALAPPPAPTNRPPSSRAAPAE